VLLASGAGAQEFPVQPYIDSAQLDVPWPKFSYYRQPWRAYQETRSGAEFLKGIGINFNAPGAPETAVRLLAESGFRAVRYEIGWGNVNWDETGFQNEARMRQVLGLFRQYHLRPTILLNANAGVPCPRRTFKSALAEDAAKGSSSVRLSDASGVVSGRTGLDNLQGYKAAWALITDVNLQTGECRLSRPLPKDLHAGDPVELSTLKYLPLYPVGTPQFDETSEGWVRYALLVCQLVRSAGIEDFDLEIWNELTFGSDFININAYYQPALVEKAPDFLHAGGTAWELAARTQRAVKPLYRGARLIWGFSNTTFFHTAVDKLPPGIEGQSYHPYGTGLRRLSPEHAPGRPALNLEGFVPTMQVCRPEGTVSTFEQTESLLRLINPAARSQHPEGTTRFFHYMTEHGILPDQCGANEPEGAWELKAKTALRAFCFWLNKGIDTLEFFAAYDKRPVGMGLLPSELPTLTPESSFDAVATLPMRAIRNLTRAFAASVPLARTAPLGLEVTALGSQRQAFAGDATHPPLWDRQEFAVLPFQLDARQFILAVYTKTDDVTTPLNAETYRLLVRGLPGSEVQVTYYDPLRDREIRIDSLANKAGQLQVDLAVADYPRLLMIRTETP
jgi:hypothetical protein